MRKVKQLLSKMLSKNKALKGLGGIPKLAVERETGLEPATFSLATKRSTAELLPHQFILFNKLLVSKSLQVIIFSFKPRLALTLRRQVPYSNLFVGCLP